jgi:hypothetical protein
MYFISYRSYDDIKVISLLYHDGVILKEKFIFKMNGFVALLLTFICITGRIYLFFKQKVIISFEKVEALLSISNKVLRSRATKNL